MIVLSDLHFGSNRNYLFNLNRWLHKEDKSQDIVLLGDTFDDFKKRQLTAADLRTISEISKFRTIRAFPGNHDAEVADKHAHYFGAKSVTFECDNRPKYLSDKVLALHGDLWDKTNPIVARAADMVYDLMLANSRTNYAWVKQLAKRRCIESFKKNAENLFVQTPSIDYIVVGHLHEQQSWEILPGKKLVCSGCFIEEESFLTIDDTVVKMRKF